MVGILTLWLAMNPGTGTDPGGFLEVELEGVVVTLTEEAAIRGLRLENDPSGPQVVLRSENGDISPLLCNAASKALFTDKRLRGRQTRIVGRRHDGLPFIEVVAFQVADADGKLRTAEYFCDVCTISVRFDQICPCCQGEMELRMKP